MKIPSGKESRGNMDGGFPWLIYSIDCHNWRTNVSWQGLAAIITRENEGSGNMHLNILYFACKESAADYYFVLASFTLAGFIFSTVLYGENNFRYTDWW